MTIFFVFDCNDDTVTFKNLDYIYIFALYDKAFSAPKIISSYRHGTIILSLVVTPFYFIVYILNFVSKTPTNIQ